MSRVFGSKYYVRNSDGKFQTAQLTPFPRASKKATAKKRRLKVNHRESHASSLNRYSTQSTSSGAEVTLVIALTYLLAMLVAIVIPQWVLVFFSALALLSFPVYVIQKTWEFFKNRSDISARERAYDDPEYQEYADDDYSYQLTPSYSGHTTQVDSKLFW